MSSTHRFEAGKNACPTIQSSPARQFTRARRGNDAHMDRSHLLTEQRLGESMNLDAMSIADAVALMSAQDAVAVAAVATQHGPIARAVELVVAALRAGGRLFYVGAGTSGRLGVLDASECPPTFRTNPDMVQGVIAGGEAAMFRSQEGAEDKLPMISCGRRSPQRQVGAARCRHGNRRRRHNAIRPWRAASRQLRRGAGGETVFSSCVQPVIDEASVDVVIRPLTGPEVVTGSTRLKAGTATKLVLNTISTVAMVHLGEWVYENLRWWTCGPPTASCRTVRSGPWQY